MEDEPSASASASINFFNYDSPIVPKLDEDQVRQWLIQEAAQEGFKIRMLNIIWTSDENLRHLSASFKGADHYTDILTFDMSDNGSREICGECYISVERVQDNARQLQQPFERELLRVMVHGLLHLMGYRDDTPAEQERMRQREEEALQAYGI